MKRSQLIRLLKLDLDNIRLSSLGRLLPPENAACKGLPYSSDINKLDCKFCILHKPSIAEQPFNVIKIDTSDVKPRRSNITGRFFCPKCINKNIDSIDESFYFKMNFDLILDLYDRLSTISTLEYEESNYNNDNRTE